jgi:NADH-quinone oxidoreductase subunit A
LFPWALDFSFLRNDSIFSIYLFLFILTLGFVFEWKKGALDWE